MYSIALSVILILQVSSTFDPAAAEAVAAQSRQWTAFESTSCTDLFRFRRPPGFERATAFKHNPNF